MYLYPLIKNGDENKADNFSKPQVEQIMSPCSEQGGSCTGNTDWLLIYLFDWDFTPYSSTFYVYSSRGSQHYGGRNPSID